jgi:hypothetical protein
MPAKDGRDAPSSLREMSNDAALVSMFPIRKNQAAGSACAQRARSRKQRI